MSTLFHVHYEINPIVKKKKKHKKYTKSYRANSPYADHLSFVLQVRVSGTAVRRALFESERGICQLCFLDAHSLYQSVTVLSVRNRPTFLAQSPYSSLPQRTLKKMVMEPKEGMVSGANASRQQLVCSLSSFPPMWNNNTSMIAGKLSVPMQSSLSNLSPLSISGETPINALRSFASPSLLKTERNRAERSGAKRNAAQRSATQLSFEDLI